MKKMWKAVVCGVLLGWVLGGCAAYGDFSRTVGRAVAPNAYDLCPTPTGVAPCAPR